MSSFRSAEMTYVQVIIPAAVAEDFTDRVAQEGFIQFSDLNEDLQPFQRQYTSDIIKIQEIERHIKSVEELLNDYNIRFDTEISPEDFDQYRRPANTIQLIDRIGKEVFDHHKELREQSTAERQLHSELSIQEDSIQVLTQIESFLALQSEARMRLQEQQQQRQQQAEYLNQAQGIMQDNAVPLLDVAAYRRDDATSGLIFSDNQNQGRGDVGFRYFAGVVTIGQRVAFERQVFLTSRGNSFVQFDEESKNEEKIPFVVFFLGDQLKRTLKRLCQFMNIEISYESDSNRSRDEMLQEANMKRADLQRIHAATKKQLNNHMKEVAEKMKNWKMGLHQEKAIRITLNKFRSHQANVLRAEGWCPTAKFGDLSDILNDVTRNKGVGNAVLTPQQPKGIFPTYFENNKYTQTFQQIVDTYGVPRYQEFNPAVPTIVTFPFLFGVMYGDIFHGSVLFLAALLIVLTEKRFEGKKLSEFVSALYNGRYILTMMGFFAIYCGLVYNDCMSIMINGFNKMQWTSAQNQKGDTVLIQHNVYSFGVDPSWFTADNKLSFENSLKMKLSVIIGVTQMTFGLCIKLFNHIYEGDVISILCEFIPQMIFMLVFFGYMIFLIIFKWCINWKNSKLEDTPSLITVLIKMVLSPGSLDETTTVYNTSLQSTIQVLFVLLMVLSIPWMLLPKPFLLRRKYERQVAMRVQYEAADNDTELGKMHGGAHGQAQGQGHGHGHEEFDFSEVFIHQLIHTIEYVLGTVSNTASYLRLWALSLAHSELSEVFYDKTLKGTLQNTGALAIIESVIGVFMFFMFTFGVLLVMDVLECFLHALRLHWVEFQNKFYYADGVAFAPFSYKLTLAKGE